MTPPLTELHVSSADGRRLVMWLTEPDPGTVARGAHPTVVIAPGFCRRMPHLAILARVLNANGACVARYDPLDHPGQSDGDSESFTMSTSLESLRLAVETAADHAPMGSVVVVPISLAARAAYRLAVTEPLVQEIVSVVGVVNLRSTLSCVFGADHLGCDLERLPEHVEFEGHRIRARPFHDDCDLGRWTHLADSCKDLARVTCPVTNFRGTHDDWVSESDLITAFSAGGGPRRIVEVVAGEHDLAKNPVAAEQMLRRLTSLVCHVPEGDVAQPTLDELAEQIGHERHLEIDARRRALTPITSGSHDLGGIP